MKKLIACAFTCLLLGLSCFSQAKENAAIEQQLKALRADNIKLTSDGNTSKLMAVAENFDDGDVKRAGIQAMNFAAGFFYPGTKLERVPEEIHITFWVLTKKPRFAERHAWMIYAASETIDIGNARYSARARDNMEYLNFTIGRDDLAKIVRESKVRFTLGDHEFEFTANQLRMLANLLTISEVK